MPRSKTPTISLEEAKARFETWRQNRKGKASIPDELWATAVEVARKEGVSRTSTELRVEWNQLKRRIAAAADLEPVLPPILTQFEQTTGIHAEAFAASNGCVWSCGSR